MREILPLASGWRFQKTTDLPQSLPSDWEEVCLPHTWNAVDGQDGGNDYWRGCACYAKEFTRPSMEKGSCVYLEVTGAAMTASVYLNGQKLCVHEGGYSTFRVPLHNLQDINLLCITVDNGENDHVYPQKADFTF
ncbi:MAG: hypothetical protein IIZ39_06780, partial [Blautia sp.]|nr:hypothetical protein [Blautia sp.]